MQQIIEDGFVEPNPTATLEPKDEYEIMQVNYFSENPDEYQKLMDLTQLPIDTSKALERLKKLRKATIKIYSNLFYFKQFLDDKQIDEKESDRQYLITSLPFQPDNEQDTHTKDYQKVLHCKYKTLKEIVSKSHVDLANFKEKLRQEEENTRTQVREMKQCASFSTDQQLFLFSRAYPLQTWFPLYMNLYCDQLASSTLNSEDIYIPFSIQENKVLVKDTDQSVFTIIVRKNNKDILYSSPMVDKNSELESFRNKRIENVLLIKYLRDKLEIPSGAIKVDLSNQFEVEFVLLPPPGKERNSQLYRKLLEIIKERKGIEVFLEFVEAINKNGKVRSFRL